MCTGNPFEPLDLKVISNLRFLGFRVYAGHEFHDVQLEWIVRGLTEGFIPSTLEELTIIVRIDPADGYTRPPGLMDICWSFYESELDSALVSGEQTYPNLREVEIIVEVPRPGKYDVDRFFDALAEKLPLLDERDLLSAQLCTKAEVQATMCTLLYKT